MEVARKLLDLSGIGSARLQLRWVSAAEGQIFADYVKELSEQIEGLGPLNRDELRVSLSAVASALDSPRLRWLTGMDRRLTEVGNVYNEKIDEEQYSRILKTAVEMEYQKAVILESLKVGPLFVRQIAEATLLPVQTVSLRLGDLQKSGKVDLHSYEGNMPKFVGLAA